MLNGWYEAPNYFKSESIYHDRNRRDEVCYIPENARDAGTGEKAEYTHNDLLNLVHQDEKLCDILFGNLNWQYPETEIDELLREESWYECECGALFDMDFSFDQSMWNPREHSDTPCPYCNPSSGMHAKREVNA